MVTEICSAVDMGGNRLAAALARKVLPVPGGPDRRRLWCPATAIVSARLAKVCPRMSSKVGESVLVFLTTAD